MEATAALDRFAREESGRLIGSLTRELGNFDLAEECVQDAIVEALKHWPEAGIPREPGAWLRVTARRKATDRLRRDARLSNRLQAHGKQLELDAESEESAAVDDRLALLFMCCHPTLSRRRSR